MTSPRLNRLAHEKSPYLLQHQHNPVDWYPWGEEAFARARRENKPIFLSIGYSTCHWCHVMERESFENEGIAELLNRYFVSIKVDREERPDLDQIYMTTVQALTGQGGWPLNCFLTPDLKPFFGGTYFPPGNARGRFGFFALLEQIHDLWESRGDEVVESAREIHQRLHAYAAHPPGDETLSPALLRDAAAAFKKEYDARHGGFGSAPKFPRPSLPAFLLRSGARWNDQEAIDMTSRTCDAMAAGGIHDQIGGGFHRYSVDDKWLVPHFEKMLYDNAQLVHLYLDACLVSGEARHAEAARGIIEYILRDMTHPEGGFYSAEDADSEGKEGKFYCWTREELAAILTPAELGVVTRYFGVTEAGNFIDHSDPDPLRGQNILSVVAPEMDSDGRHVLTSAKQKIWKARERRPRPHRDDKVLASWNGLMLGAVARASSVLGDEDYLAAAEKNLAFLRARLWDGQNKRLYHRWRDGERDSAQLLEDYANLLMGVVDLYEATLKAEHLEFALDLADTMLESFYDSENGGFFQSASDSEDLILRMKEHYDGAQPSGNAVAVLGLLRLAAISGREEFKSAAERTLRLFAVRMREAPQSVPYLLLGLDFFLAEPKRVVVSGENAKRLLRAVHSVYQPNKVVLGNRGPVDPLAKKLPSEKNTKVFICAADACQGSVDNAEEVRKLVAGD